MNLHGSGTALCQYRIRPPSPAWADRADQGCSHGSADMAPSRDTLCHAGPRLARLIDRGASRMAEVHTRRASPAISECDKVQGPSTSRSGGHDQISSRGVFAWQYLEVCTARCCRLSR